MALTLDQTRSSVVGRTERSEFRHWIALKVVYAVTRSTRYGLRSAQSVCHRPKVAVRNLASADDTVQGRSS